MSGLTALQPGLVFAGDYRILQPLREGGMGAVYVVEQISTAEKRALKVMQPALVDKAEARRRFEREAKVGARIKSDFVVKVIQAGVDAPTGMPWMAMELLEGEELETLLERRERLPPDEVLEVFDQLCDALGKAHEAGIVHRDLKPANIFLATPRRRRERFNVKVLDFGIARLLAEAQTTDHRTRGMLGTPLFMAPEQARPGAQVLPSADVWALGLIAFRALSGKHFWRTVYDDAPTLVMLGMEAYSKDAPPASTRAADYGVVLDFPPGFDAWFARCVRLDASARFQDATAAFAALETVLAPGRPPRSVPRASPSSPSSLSTPTPGPTLAGAPLDAAATPEPPPASTVQITQPGTPPPTVPLDIQTTIPEWQSGTAPEAPAGRRWKTLSGVLAAALVAVLAVGFLTIRHRHGHHRSGTSDSADDDLPTLATVASDPTPEAGDPPLPPPPTDPTSPTEPTHPLVRGRLPPPVSPTATSSASAVPTLPVIDTPPPPSATTPAGAGADPANDVQSDSSLSEAGLRRSLEPKVWNGTASLDEIRMLKDICTRAHDQACASRATLALQKKVDQSR